MEVLNKCWRPGFGVIYTWFAMDKHGSIAVMVNNCFGDLPKALLGVEGVSSLLDQMSEFIWEESHLVSVYPEKNGRASVDLFSAWRNEGCSISDVEKELQRDLLISGKQSEFNLAANKGFYVYHGVEGDRPGVDYPVGYSGKSEMGDYFRYLVPSIFADISDFPECLRRGVAVSEDVDFSLDRLIKNNSISERFPAMYR